MSIFEVHEYKSYVRERIKGMATAGRGEYRRIAAALRMQPTSISQIFSGEKDLTLEQAAKLCKHWQLLRQEADYFLNLVELARAESPELKEIILARISFLRAQAQSLVNRIHNPQVLSEADKNKFYSKWYYSAISLLAEVDGFNSLDPISQRLNLPRQTASEAIHFLISSGLLAGDESSLKAGTNRTHLEESSPLVTRHHTNWRLKCIENFEKVNRRRDLLFSGPLTISDEDAEAVRSILVNTIEKILKVTHSSKSETLRCLNIDWIDV